MQHKMKEPIHPERSQPPSFIPDRAIAISEALKEQTGHPETKTKSKDPYREDRVSIDEPSNEDAKDGQPDTRVCPG